MSNSALVPEPGDRAETDFRLEGDFDGIVERQGRKNIQRYIPRRKL